MSDRKLKIYKELRICFICITLFCINVFGFSNLDVYADDQIPVIVPVALAKVVVINAADSVQSSYSTLQAAMQAIGTNSGNYTIVFVENYLLTAADKVAVTENGANAHLTITSTYKNDSNITIRRDISNSSTWICNSDTTFKDISLSTYFDIYGNCHKLTIGTGVMCASASGNICGGSNTDKTGNADVTILSGKWRSVKSGGASGTMTGNAVMNIGGTAVITTSISAAAGVTGRVTVNVDGSSGATVQSFTETIATDEFNINLNNAKITGNLFLGNANLNISGECIAGTSITAGATAEITIKLSDAASLDNGTAGYFNCPKANLIFGTGSKLTCNGKVNRVNNIVIEGSGAKLDVKKGNPMTVSGTCTGKNKLNIDFTNNTAPEPFDIFLKFTTGANADKNNYSYPQISGYDGIVTINGHIVYLDFIPPEDYVYDWYGTTSLYVGGHDATLNTDDLKCHFGLKTSMNQNAFRLWSGQLTAKINGYMGGKAFTNYYAGNSPDFKYTIKVNSVIYNLTGNGNGMSPITPSAVFRGYKKSADGSNLDLVFYLGRDVGIVYLHLTINPGSTVMSESWDYVNLSNSIQNIIMSHGGDITYAGVDRSYCISRPGWDKAFVFQVPSEPVMFMWVDQFTTQNPVVAGTFQGISVSVDKSDLYHRNLPETVISGTAIDTGMGIQWQYKVAAGTAQSASGGTAFGRLGRLQIMDKDITFINPGKEDISKTASHSSINISNSKIVLTKDDWSIEGLPDGITVTGIPDSLSVSPANTTDFDLTYTANLSVLPGTYPVNYMITKGTETYTFTDNITVIRDEVKITAAVKNEDNTENTTAISGIMTAAMFPVAGAEIYKYYDGRLSWTLDYMNYEIKVITVDGTELTATELAWTKVNSYLAFDEMTENQDVVIYVGKVFGAPTNKVTISKTAVGGPADQSFTFTITAKDKNGTALTDGTVLNCRGGIITGSGVMAPDTVILILDANGQAEFNLKNGQTLEIIGIPAEGKIQITEADYAPLYTTKNVKDGVWTNGRETGEFVFGAEDVVIDYTNTRESIPVTGISTCSRTLVLTLGIMFAWCSIFGFRMHRRRKVR